jgi:hypothetical protein
MIVHGSQGQRASMRANISAGHDSPWKPSNAAAPSSRTPQQSSPNSKPRSPIANFVPHPSEPTKGTAASPR